MFCLRCGKETRDPQVFCDSCLQDMAAYPVNPNTPVNLPNRENKPSPKKAPKKKKVIKPEEQVIHLQKILRWMMVLLAAAVVIMCVAVGMLVMERQEDSRPDGKNYITVTDINEG